MTGDVLIPKACLLYDHLKADMQVRVEW